MGLSDEAGAGANVGLAVAARHLPTSQAAAALDAYIQHTLWGIEKAIPFPVSLQVYSYKQLVEVSDKAPTCGIWITSNDMVSSDCHCAIASCRPSTRSHSGCSQARTLPGYAACIKY